MEYLGQKVTSFLTDTDLSLLASDDECLNQGLEGSTFAF
jgi:hypothetical protein